MKIKIGVIAPEKSIEYIKKVQEYIEDKCEIIYLPYDGLADIKNVYINNYKFLDGIILSGELTHDILIKEVEIIEKPNETLMVTREDFYKTLLQITINNRNLDFSRVYIDFIFQSNDYLGLKDILDEKNFPHVLNPEMNCDVTDIIFKRHIYLWKNKKIDFSITRVSSIIDELNKNNIKNIFIFPSKESIIKAFEDLVKEIQLIRLESNLIVVGNITIDNLNLVDQNIDNDLELKYMLLHKALIEYSNKNNISFIIQKSGLGFEVFTSNGELKDLTKDFSSCSLLNYLRTSLAFTVSIGWGIGNTIYESRLNAQNANREANNNGGNCSFIITETETVIGPLSEEGCLQYSNAKDPSIEKLSTKLGISSLNIQKIMSVLKKLNTNELTADDLAFHLGITLRSSNRILNKLVEKGGAEISYLKQEKLRGRPKKVYSIKFL